MRMGEFYRIASVTTGLRMDEALRDKIEEAQYADVLRDLETMRIEVNALIPEITRAESVFFRYRQHFELLKTCLIPEVLRRIGTDRPIRIWDAGCGTGEEAYSIAMMLDIYFRAFAGEAYIVGTDLNFSALDVAIKGAYGPSSVEGLTEKERSYFAESDGVFELRRRLASRVRFVRHNLIDDLTAWKHAGLMDMDIVICRDEDTVYCRRQLLGPGRVIGAISPS